MISTKSRKRVAAVVALAAGKDAFRDYAHKFSPKKYTQPQLFACLVLKECEKRDYRGVWQLLLDCSDLREAIGLASVPDVTTLQKAGRKLLKLCNVHKLIENTVGKIHGRTKVVQHAAADSTGFDQHRTSRY